MIDGQAGGHTFVMGLCSCGRRLVDLRGITKENCKSFHGISHTGLPTDYEIDQINQLIEKMDAASGALLGWN